MSELTLNDHCTEGKPHVIWCPLSWLRDLSDPAVDRSLEYIDLWSSATYITSIGSNRSRMRLSRTSTSGWKAIDSITQFLHPGNVWSASLQRRWPGRKDYFRHHWAVRRLKSHQWPTNTPLHSGSPPTKAAAGFWVPGYVWFGSVPTSQASYEYGHW